MKTLRCRVTSTCLALGVALGTAEAQTSNPAAAQSTAGPAGKHSLWQAHGATNRVFLVGSLHVMKEGMYPLAPEIEAAYRRAKVVVFETDIKAVESPEFSMKVMAEAEYPANQSLQKSLSPAVLSLLVSNLQIASIDIEMIDRYKPWMAAITLVMVELQRQGFDPAKGLDRHFHTRARADQKQIDHFEAAEFQMKLLTELGGKESEEFLAQSLSDMKIWKSQFAQMATAWSEGDTQALDSLILDAFREYPLMHQKFLLNRNRAWMGKLEALLKANDDVLVVVGVGHLIGKGGLVDLLERAGYKVEQR